MPDRSITIIQNVREWATLDSPTIGEFIDTLDGMSRQVMTLSQEDKPVRIKLESPNLKSELKFYNLSELLLFLNGMLFIQNFFKGNYNETSS